MKTLLKNARILTMKDDKIFFGHVVVEDNRIKEVGPAVNIYADYDKVIDCEGNLLMPGFKNSHTHSAMTFLRSVADDSSLHDWLFKEVFPREDNLKEGHVTELTKVAILEYLTSGITAVYDQYFYPMEFEATAAKFGFRLVNALMFNPVTRPIKTCLKLCEANKKKDYLVKYHISLHSEYTSDDNMLKSTKELLDKTKTPFSTHLAETSSEVEDCYARRGVSPLAYLDSLGFFDYGGAIYHGIYLSDDDIEIIKKRKLIVVSNPSSNMKLASGVCEVKKLLANNIPVALGTDGPASNNALDMFREMYLVTGLQKLILKDPISIPAFEVLKMATVNGAKAMDLKDADTLEVGKLADIIMIDLHRPSMQPLTNIINNIVYSGSKDVIKMTMINGRVLYYNQEFFVGEDTNEIYKSVQKLTDELSIIKDKNKKTGLC